MSDAPDPLQPVDEEGLMCALVLVPEAFARNRFFELYQDGAARHVRERARWVRGIIEQLVGGTRPRAEIVGEQVLEDGQVLLRYRVPELAFERASALTPLEAAVLRYAVYRAGAGPLAPGDRDQVRSALRRLAEQVDLPPDALPVDEDG